MPVGETMLQARLQYHKCKLNSGHQVYINSVNLMKYFLNQEERWIYAYVHEGKLYINRQKLANAIKRKVTPNSRNRYVTISIPSKLAASLTKSDERRGHSRYYTVKKWWSIAVVLVGFPENVTYKYDKTAAAKLGYHASEKILQQRYGKNWHKLLAKQAILKRRRLRNLQENKLIRTAIMAGIPVALWETELSERDFVPDLMLPGRIIMEFAGRSDSLYVKKLTQKTKVYKDAGYEVIIVGTQNRILNKLKAHRELPVITYKTYLNWIQQYAAWLKNALAKLNQTLKSPPLPIPN